MKTLIWIGCLILNYIMQIIISVITLLCIPVVDDTSRLLAEGIGWLLMPVRVGFCFWLALKLCKKWDWYRIKKKSAKAGMTVSEYARYGLTEKFLEKLDTLCKSVPIPKVKPLLKELKKQKKITKDQYIIFLDEYYDKK